MRRATRSVSAERVAEVVGRHSSAATSGRTKQRGDRRNTGLPLRGGRPLVGTWVHADTHRNPPRRRARTQDLHGGHFQRTTRRAYTHDCTVLADSSHGDSHVGSVSPAATRTRTLALTLTQVTGYMLLAASLVVLPQLLANHSGRGLELPDPFHGCPGQPAVSTWASFTATVSTAMGGLS